MIYFLALIVGIGIGTVALIISLWFFAPDAFKKYGMRFTWTLAAGVVTVNNLLSLVALSVGFVWWFILVFWFAALFLLFARTFMDAVFLTIANFLFTIILAWPVTLLLHRFN